MHNNAVPTKTISIELDVYQKLVDQRQGPSERFSRVLRRARWDDRPKGRAVDILASLARLPNPSGEELAEWEAIEAQDRPADDKWIS